MRLLANGDLTTLAGSGSNGFVNGPALSATFNEPYGGCVDLNGNTIVADYSNHLIRKITPDGTVSTLAGQAQFYGSTDGSGTVAKFFFPRDVACDFIGNYFVADEFSNKIRKITPKGIVSTFVGTGANSIQEGFGTSASISGPTTIAIDAAGVLFVTGTFNSVLRISQFGQVTVLSQSTSVGSDSGAFVNGVGIAAKFCAPNGIAFDRLGQVFIGDYTNRAIRRMQLLPPQSCLPGYFCPLSSSNMTICPFQFYCPVSNLDAPVPCPQGLFCDSLGLSVPRVCQQGFFCPVGSNSSTAQSCPSGNFCPSNSTNANLCPAGYFCPSSTCAELLFQIYN